MPDENNHLKDLMMDSRGVHSDVKLDLERLALVLAGSRQGFWDWDVRTGEVRRNERWAEILGYTLDEIEPTVRQGEDLIHPDDLEAARRSLREHLEGRTQAHESEHRMRAKDGNYRWVLDTGRVVERDTQGRPTRMCGTHSDITKRKQAEESLRASELQFRSLVGNIPGMVYQAQPDWSAQIISHSVEVCGYSLEEFSSRSVSWQDLIHPDDRVRVVQEGSTLADRQDSLVQEYRIIAKDGRTVWVSDHKSSVFTDEGKLERIDGVVFDITERRRMEEALEKQSAFLRTIIDLNPNLIFAKDREGRFTLVNRAVADAYGTTVDNLVGKSDADFNPNRDEVESFRRADREVMDTLQVRSIPEEQITDATGRRRWLQTVKIPLIGEGGRAEQVLGVATDITVRREAEEQLRKFSRAVEQSITTVLITDAEGAIEYVNPTFTRLSGYRAEEVIGKKASISKSGITRREEYARLWQTIKAGGEWKGEFLNKRKDGQLYWVSSSISPIRDGNGVIVNFLAIQEDVTERKRIEEALATQNEYLSALNDISLGILSRLSLEDVLQSVIQRAAQLLGTSSGAILLLDPERNELEIKFATGVFASGVGRRVQRGEGVGGKVWGTGRPLVINDYRSWDGRSPQASADAIRCLAGTPLVSGSQVIGVLLIGYESDSPKTFGKAETDILNRFGQMVSIGIDNARLYAEAQRARIAAEAANTAKSNFLSSMSHELRTPLNAILGFSQLLGRDPHLSAQHREYVETVNESGHHLMTLINDVLELSKIEAGQLTLNDKSFDLYETLGSIRELFFARTAEKGLVLDYSFTPDVPQYVYTDETKLRQILMNLLGNAVKFTGEGRITVRVTSRHPSVKEELLQIEVEDSGPGILPEDLERIFEPFVQVSNPRMQGGTGLGLPISRQFARLMGGDITVRSTPGKGTIFQCTVRVVRVDAGEVGRPRPRRRVLGTEPGQPAYRLLVADDDAATRRLVVEMLRPLGFEVKEAAGGKQALDSWKRWEPHLIWMDIRMPDMDGREVTRRIKATPQGRSTIVVALTAYTFKEDREAILHEGCDDFVRKPFREEEIYDVLSKHLGVRFVYGDQLPAARPPRHATPARSGDAPVTAAVSGFSADMVTDLRDATRRADLQGILGLIEQLRPHNPTLADELATMAQDFEYGRILNLLGKGGEQE